MHMLHLDSMPMWLAWRLVSFMNIVETRIRSIDEHVEKTRRHLEKLGD